MINGPEDNRPGAIRHAVYDIYVYIYRKGTGEMVDRRKGRYEKRTIHGRRRRNSRNALLSSVLFFFLFFYWIHDERATHVPVDYVLMEHLLSSKTIGIFFRRVFFCLFSPPQGVTFSFCFINNSCVLQCHIESMLPGISERNSH